MRSVSRYGLGRYRFRACQPGGYRLGQRWLSLCLLGVCLLAASGTTAADPGTVMAAGAGSDLSVWTDHRHEAVQPGRPFRLNISLVNNGPDLAREVGVRLSLPDQLQQIDTRGCDNDPQGIPDCVLGSLRPDETRTFELHGVLPPGEYAVMSLGVRALTVSHDPLPANNVATTEIRPAFPQPAIDTQGLLLLLALVLTFASVLFIMVRESQRNYRLMRPRH